MLEISQIVSEALKNNKPVVALESTVLAHGLPYPENLKVFRRLEELVKDNNCVPATIGVLKGKVKIGMSEEEVVELIKDNPIKVGTRELPYAVSLKKSAATTVSSTARLASFANIKVFATGGIGGVHRGEWDVSQDIMELSNTNIIVVSAGCKSILDIRRTLEFLETFQVLTLGYKTEYFPIFYNGLSDERIYKVESTKEIAKIFVTKESLGIKGAILVANPIPKVYEIDNDEIERYIEIIEKEMENVKGKEVTPYILKRLVELSNGRTLESNIKLLENNVELACKIAQSLEW
ncbi:pseudouridine-5'-phosphate glycosidase [Thermosipho affectus]|uniref:Pseudouridine-5'-phosphate glycosidase n=1 Tax=Thermosipho affectus TaxID=660294 RepID=A0ABX3IG93_9BACT|nr:MULTISPECIES: pseudouridine-5'-phosphate glycosidase [Thermosipho]ONN26852.1 pseudouridine-5'-phosphate glycosidase [Thermosipho affectus]